MVKNIFWFAFFLSLTSNKVYSPEQSKQTNKKLAEAKENIDKVIEQLDALEKLVDPLSDAIEKLEKTAKENSQNATEMETKLKKALDELNQSLATVGVTEPSLEQDSSVTEAQTQTPQIPSLNFSELNPPNQDPLETKLPTSPPSSGRSTPSSVSSTTPRQQLTRRNSTGSMPK